MLFFILIKWFILYISVKSSYCTPKACDKPSGFTSKSIQALYPDNNIQYNIEFIDICHSIKSDLKSSRQFYELENRMTVDERFIAYLKVNLKQFGFTVENVLGKGNYGVVFAAKSQVYGNVAIKIAANKDGAFYDTNTKQECCYYPSNNCPRCSKPIFKLLPFEVANSLLTIDAEGVVKSKAFGIISSYNKLVFYIIVMEKIENSMTLLSFAQKCFKQFNKNTRANYIREAVLKLNEINKNLIKNFHIFHNDLKSDNILISLKKDNSQTKNKCGNGQSELLLYLIDFGNAIVNVNQKDSKGNSLLLYDQIKYKKYFIYYRAPDVSCQMPNAKLPQVLSWYLGVVALEMCGNGVEGVMLAPDNQICYPIRMNMNLPSNANSYDQVIVHDKKTKHQGMCHEPLMANFLQQSLNFNPNTRLSSDSLMKNKFISSSETKS